MINPCFGSAVFEMHGSVCAVYVRDWSAPLDSGMLECFVAEVGVVAAADYGVDGRSRAVNQADCGIGRRDGSTDGDDFLYGVSLLDIICKSGCEYLSAILLGSSVVFCVLDTARVFDSKVLEPRDGGYKWHCVMTRGYYDCIEDLGPPVVRRAALMLFTPPEC